MLLIAFQPVVETIEKITTRIFARYPEGVTYHCSVRWYNRGVKYITENNGHVYLLRSLLVLLNRPRECDLLPRFERRAAPVREFDDVEPVRVLKKETQPHEFTANGAPFGTGMFATDVVGGK